MTFIEDLKTKHNISLNPQQKEAVLAIEGATCLLAVPGSGKTTVIVARIGNMIFEHSIPPEQILTLTFSVAAANDMKERFIRLFGNEYDQRLQFKTIHSFCLGVIKEYERVQNTKAFTVIKNIIHIIKKIYLQKYNEYISEDETKEIIQKIGYCKNMMYTVEQINEIELSSSCNFYDIYIAYDQYKKQNSLMDYDDMLQYSLNILNQKPEILSKYQNEFKYFNVDEAQDTSLIQHRIIKLLVQKSGNIFMVGDEDQSIYGFRAAFPQALLDFKKDYRNANVLKMEQNYRSTQKIVKAADQFIKSNKNRFPKNMFSTNLEGVDIKIKQLADLNHQYRYIVELLKKEGKDDIAILYRNNDSAVALVDQFNYENIPFKIREHDSGFFSHFVTLDIICFLRLAQNNADIESFEKIYYKTQCGITKPMLHYVKENMKHSVFDTLLEINNISEWNKQKIKELKVKFLKLKHLETLEAIEFIEDSIGYKEYLFKFTNVSAGTLVHKLDILKIISLKKNRTDDFVKRLKELEDLMRTSNGKTGCTLTTVHSSKGLEFDKVIMIDILENQFPSKESIEKMEKDKDPTLLEEERRLFYVGVTRARHELEIITSTAFNGRVIRTSRFVYNLTGQPNQQMWNSQIATQPAREFPSRERSSFSNQSYKSQIYTQPANEYQYKDKDSFSGQKQNSRNSIGSNEKNRHETKFPPKPKEPVRGPQIKVIEKTNEISAVEIASYQVGTKVFHKSFGTGTIKDVVGQVVHVDFAKYGRKKLALRMCLEQELMNKVI